MAGIKRNLFNKINRLLESFPVVIILGVRQCGKTTLAKQVRPDWYFLDLEKSSDFRKLVDDFDFFFKEHPQHVIIDEAQQSPQLFEELKAVIDNDRSQKNRFLLTGSSSPLLIKNVSETLAGRVGIVDLGTFKINEIYKKPLSAFYKIFESPLDPHTQEQLLSLKTALTHDHVMNTFLKGGYPEPVLANNNTTYRLWMHNYYQTYFQRDLRALFPRLDFVKYQRFITMLSALTGTIINKSEVGSSLDTSEVTVRDYLDIAQGSFFWRSILSFENSVSQSIVKKPKGNFRDSGLAHYLQNVQTREELINHHHVGANFEAFVTEEIIKGLDATLVTGWNYFFYRTKHGAEVDLVLTGPFGVLPIEIKFGMNTSPRRLVSLKEFIAKNNYPLALVINNADKIERLASNIIQLPATFL